MTENRFLSRYELRATAFLAGCGCLTLAAQLPQLTAVPANNHGFQIRWNYTNSGFAFQETSNLTAASWQTGALTPAFNSNDATFSVSASATNASEFFRLARPSDLRGIYLSTSDVSTISGSYAQKISQALSVPDVDGLLLTIGWNAIEPTNDIYNWTTLDLWVNRSAAMGKKLDLAIRAGSSIPGWLFDPITNGGAGAMPVQFTVSPQSGTTGDCVSETNAAPWDTNFLGAWKSMLGAVASHLKSANTYSNLTLLRLTGINRTTDELRLPAETAQSTGLACVSDAPAIWQAAGYTPDKVLFGWSNIVNAFQGAFPDKSFCVAIILGGAFPPIDNNTNIITGSRPDPNQPLLALAAQELPGRLVVQYNSLLTSNTAAVEVPQSAQRDGTLMAYQCNNYFGPSGGGSACGGTAADPVACTEAEYLEELQEGIYPLGQTNALRSQYIEVFPANVLAFTNDIRQAHQELLPAGL